MNAQSDPVIEKRLRASLKVTRMFVAYAPFKVVRGLQNLALNRVKLPNSITAKRLAHPAGEWFTSTAADEQSPVVMYVHGGGFVLPLSHLHRNMLAHLTSEIKGQTLMVDYRLAPEHPFPAGLDDCLGAYQYLLEQGIAPQRITVMGDSAGGNLILAMLIALRDRGIELPARGISLSAPTDFTAENPAHFRTDILLHPRATNRFSVSYVADQDVRNPLISPLFADLRGLPPLILYAGGDEALCGDSERFAEAAQAAGVEVSLKVYPRMWHVWQLMLELPQAQESLAEIAEAIQSGHEGAKVGVKVDVLAH